MFTLRFNTLDCGSESTLIVEAAKICSPSSSLIRRTQQAGPCLGPKGSVFSSLGKIIHEKVMISPSGWGLSGGMSQFNSAGKISKFEPLLMRMPEEEEWSGKTLSRKQPVQPSCWHGLAWASWKRKRKAEEVICRLDNVPIWQAQHPNTT